ncbi:MAG: hypothetical protein QN178_10045 [Armatimonadota bacterium]|nr:hypothetical protein [Armatimonadota bacterium]
MPQYYSVAIAAIYALIGFLPLAGRNIRRPWLWVSLTAGIIAGFFAREAVKLAAEALAPYTLIATGPTATVVNLVIAGAVGELLKVMAPLAIIMLAPTDAGTGMAYGAAAGAGFGVIVVQQGVALALGLVGSPFITPASTIVAVAGWFFRVLPHIVTTGYVARAGVRGGLGGALLLAMLVQAALGLVEGLPLLAGIPLGLVVTALVSIALYVYLWGLRPRAAGESAVGP